MPSKKVLVTGSEGFIGSHLVEQLVLDGMAVRAFVLYNSFGSIGWLADLPKEVLSQVEIIYGDLRDVEIVSKAVKGSDFVAHLGALIAIPYSYDAPRSYIDTNVTGTLNILNSCLAHDVTRLVHTSTSEVYGTAKYAPMDEKHPIHPQSPYAASKAGADHLVESFVASFDLNATILRPFNTFGPRQSQRAIIPTVVSQALVGKDEIVLGNTSSTRDFTYVSDTVNGFLLALRTSEAQGMTINLGTGSEWEISEIVRIICEITGADSRIQHSQERMRPHKSEVERLMSDNSLARTVLRWEPKYVNESGLTDALTMTINWFKNNMAKSGIRADKYYV
jgi:dTDP-glucose 4,6-dehydratase